MADQTKPASSLGQAQGVPMVAWPIVEMFRECLFEAPAEIKA